MDDACRMVSIAAEPVMYTAVENPTLSPSFLFANLVYPATLVLSILLLWTNLLLKLTRTFQLSADIILYCVHVIPLCSDRMNASAICSLKPLSDAHYTRGITGYGKGDQSIVPAQ